MSPTTSVQGNLATTPPPHSPHSSAGRECSESLNVSLGLQSRGDKIVTCYRTCRVTSPFQRLKGFERRLRCVCVPTIPMWSFGGPRGVLPKFISLSKFIAQFRQSMPAVLGIYFWCFNSHKWVISLNGNPSSPVWLKNNSHRKVCSSVSKEQKLL